ncbi:unnamed protein product [Amoebophrya sp. A25]|nr:unnamed protein product [Amoebophrya sp. A25]|eukprot:GSA25T00013596001.1
MILPAVLMLRVFASCSLVTGDLHLVSGLRSGPEKKYSKKYNKVPYVTPTDPPCTSFSETLFAKALPEDVSTYLSGSSPLKEIKNVENRRLTKADIDSSTSSSGVLPFTSDTTASCAHYDSGMLEGTTTTSRKHNTSTSQGISYCGVLVPKLHEGKDKDQAAIEEVTGGSSLLVVPKVVFRHLVSGNAYAEIPIASRKGGSLRALWRSAKPEDPVRRIFAPRGCTTARGAACNRPMRLYHSGTQQPLDFDEVLKGDSEVGVVDLTLAGHADLPLARHLRTLRSDLEAYMNNDGSLKLPPTRQERRQLPQGSGDEGGQHQDQVIQDQGGYQEQVSDELEDGDLRETNFYLDVLEWIAHLRDQSSGFFYAYRAGAAGQDAREGQRQQNQHRREQQQEQSDNEDENDHAGLPKRNNGDHQDQPLPFMLSAESQGLLQVQAEAVREGWEIQIGDPYLSTRHGQRYDIHPFWHRRRLQTPRRSGELEEQEKTTNRGSCSTGGYPATRTSAKRDHNGSTASSSDPSCSGPTTARTTMNATIAAIRDSLFSHHSAPVPGGGDFVSFSGYDISPDHKTLSVVQDGDRWVTYEFQRPSRRQRRFLPPQPQFAWKCTLITVDLTGNGAIFALSQRLGT